MVSDAPVIADATEADIGPIFDIYDHFVRHSTATFETEARSDRERRAWNVLIMDLHLDE